MKALLFWLVFLTIIAALGLLLVTHQTEACLNTCRPSG